MDAHKITSAVLSAINDDVAVAEYGHGHLVTMPVGFYDEDLVTLFVEPYEAGIRVSDQGTTAMRLHMANVDLDNAKISHTWAKSVAALGGRTAASEDGVIAAWGDPAEVGRLLVAVAEAAMRVDQLRWATQERQPTRFSERVVHQLRRITRDEALVTPNAYMPQTSGRTRRVTAAVGPDQGRSVFVQAISASSGDYAFEHCFYIFSHADVSRDRLLAVASGEALEKTRMVGELQTVADVESLDDHSNLERQLLSRISALQ